MTDQERMFWMSAWNALIVFVSAWYLTGGFVKALLIGAFVFGCCVVGLGRRWILRGGFAFAVLAVGVALGIPHPEQWPDLLSAAPGAIEAARSLLASVRS